MNHQHETPLMKSTNFEFLRGRHPKLVESAAVVESLIHKNSAEAVRLLRSFAEHLLHAFVIDKGRGSIEFTKEFGFEDLLKKCENQSRRWSLSKSELQDFRRLQRQGNKAVHNAEFEPDSPMTLLEAAWMLASSIARKCEWGEAPEKFTEPPRGGEKEAKLRRQRDEAVCAAAERPVDLSGWITENKISACPRNEFVGREAVFRWIAKSLTDTTNRVLLIEGQPGRGKTTLLSHFLAEKLPSGIKPFEFFFEFVFEDGKASTDRLTWIRHLYASFLKHFDLSETSRDIFSEDPETLVSRLFNRTVEVCEGHPEQRILFVLDAIDEAGPEARAAVKSLLHQSWPDQVQFLVTFRPGCLENFHCFNLEDPDRVNESRNDGRVYVDQRTPHLPEEQREQIARLGAGNFLVLKQVCADLPQDTSLIATHLEELSRLKNAGRDLRVELERRTWRRFSERLNDGELDNVHRVLGLLAISRKPVPARMVKAVVLNRSQAAWEKFTQHAGEYIRKSVIHQTHPGGSTAERDGSDSELEVYSLYHATFAELVRQELKDELQNYRRCLIDCCQEWVKELIQGKKKTFESFERDYALRHLIQHLLEAEEEWNRLEANLVNLRYIQARFEAGQGFDLLAEYQEVLERHPDPEPAFKQRVEQDGVLHKYVNDIVEYSRRCAVIRRRGGNEPLLEILGEVQNEKLPNPPDSRPIIEEMQRKVRRASKRKRHSAAFDRIREFHRFVHEFRESIHDAPQTVRYLAESFSADGPVTEAAIELEDRENRSYRLRRESGFPQRGNEPYILQKEMSDTLEPSLGENWMTPDARMAACRIGEDINVFDLRTGRPAPAGQSRIVALSPGGRWAVTVENGEFRLSEVGSSILSTRKTVCIPSAPLSGFDSFGHYFNSLFGITPDGSLVAVVMACQFMESTPPDDANKPSEVNCYRLYLWDTNESEFGTTIELGSEMPCDLVLSLSGMTVAIQQSTGLWTCFDTIRGEELAVISCDQSRSDEPFHNWCLDELQAAQARGTANLKTHDGLLELIPSSAQQDGTAGKEPMLIRHDSGREQCVVSSFELDRIHSISADGRYALREGCEWHALEFIDLVALVRKLQSPAESGGLAGEGVEGGRKLPVARMAGIAEIDDLRSPGGSIGAHSECDLRALPDTREALLGLNGDENLRRELSSLDALHRNFKAGPIQLSADQRTLVVGWERRIELLPAHVLVMPDDRTGSGDMDHPVPDQPGLEHPTEPSVDLSPSEMPPVLLFDLKTGDREELPQGLELIRITKDGAALVLRENRGSIIYWSLARHERLNGTEESASARVADEDASWYADVVEISPDGRWLAGSFYDYELRKNVIQCKRLSLHESDIATLEDGFEGISGYGVGNEIARHVFTPDGEAVLTVYEGGCCLQSIEDGSLLGIAHGTSGAWIDVEGQIRGEDGCVTGFRVEKWVDKKPAEIIPWVTAVKLFNPAERRYGNEITYCCRRCGKRSELPEEVQNAIKRIHLKFLEVKDPIPVLHLPDEAWHEPGLELVCANCEQKHRSTPWFVDRSTC